MKIKWGKLFLWVAIIWLFGGLLLIYVLDTRHQAAGTRMDSIIGGASASMHGKVIPVVVINMSQDGALNSENVLLRGDLYLLMKRVDATSRVFFNDLDSLQYLDNSQQGLISLDSNPDVYNNLLIGQFTRGGKAFNEKTALDMGVRAIDIYTEPKEVENYGQVIGEVVMANGNRYPLQIIQVESRYLGL